MHTHACALYFSFFMHNLFMLYLLKYLQGRRATNRIFQCLKRVKRVKRVICSWISGWIWRSGWASSHMMQSVLVYVCACVRVCVCVCVFVWLLAKEQLLVVNAYFDRCLRIHIGKCACVSAWFVCLCVCMIRVFDVQGVWFVCVVCEVCIEQHTT